MHNEVIVQALRRCAAMALILLPGCVFSRPPQAVVIAVAPDTVRLGDSVAIRVTLENISKRPLWFEGNNCYGVFQALNDAGEQVGSAYEGLACAAYSVRVRLDPGRKHEYVAYWLGFSVLPPPKRVTVAPGQYRIVPIVGGFSPNVIKGWVPARTVGSTVTVVQ